MLRTNQRTTNSRDGTKCSFLLAFGTKHKPALKKNDQLGLPLHLPKDSSRQHDREPRATRPPSVPTRSGQPQAGPATYGTKIAAPVHQGDQWCNALSSAPIAFSALPALNHVIWLSLNVWFTGNSYEVPSGRTPLNVKGFPGANSVSPKMDTLSNGPTCTHQPQKMCVRAANCAIPGPMAAAKSGNQYCCEGGKL